MKRLCKWLAERLVLSAMLLIGFALNTVLFAVMCPVIAFAVSLLYRILFGSGEPYDP